MGFFAKKKKKEKKRIMGCGVFQPNQRRIFKDEMNLALVVSFEMDSNFSLVLFLKLKTDPLSLHQYCRFGAVLNNKISFVVQFSLDSVQMIYDY